MELAQNRDRWGLGVLSCERSGCRVLLPEQCLFNVVSLLAYHPLYSIQKYDMKFFCRKMLLQYRLKYTLSLQSAPIPACLLCLLNLASNDRIGSVSILCIGTAKLSTCPIATRGNKAFPKFMKLSSLYILSRPLNSSCGNCPLDLRSDCSCAILLLDKVQKLLKFFTTQHHSLF